MAVHNLLGLQEEFEDTKEVIRIRKSKTNRQRNGQKIEDTTKGVIRIRKSKTNRQHNGQVIEDTEGVIRIRKSKKDWQHNGQKKRDKRTYNDIQNIHIKDRITRTPLKTLLLYVCLFVCLMVFSATFNNISAILLWSILLVEETRGPGENHRPAASHWQLLSHI